MKYKRRKGVQISKAKTYTFKGVNYKSGLERYMAQQLYYHNIDFRYEKVTFKLQNKFKFDQDSYEKQSNGKGEFKNRGNKTIQPITYKPDFVGHDFIIETKGYANESFPLRWKMFKYHLYSNMDRRTIYKPQTQKECDTTIKLILEKRKHNGKS